MNVFCAATFRFYFPLVTSCLKAKINETENDKIPLNTEEKKKVNKKSFALRIFDEIGRASCRERV